MMHEYHPGLEGFDARQIWHDGCAECERRGQSLPRSIGNLDTGTFRRAWERAQAYQAGQDVGHVSAAEAPLLNTLGYIGHSLHQSGLAVVDEAMVG